MCGSKSYKHIRKKEQRDLKLHTSRHCAARAEEETCTGCGSSGVLVCVADGKREQGRESLSRAYTYLFRSKYPKEMTSVTAATE